MPQKKACRTIWIPLTAVMFTKAPLQAQECSQGWHPFVVGGNFGVDGTVRCMTEWNGQLIVGGDFQIAGGTQAFNVARWDGISWSALGSGTSADVLALTVWRNKLVVGGNFGSASGQTVNRIATWDGTSWQSLASGGQVGVPSPVNALTVWNNDLIAGGAFVTAGGQTVNHIARWDGTSWHDMSSGGDIGVSNTVHALTVYDNNVVAAGAFGSAGGQTVNKIARWDGSAWHAFASGNQIGFASQVGGWLTVLVTHGDTLVAAGASLNSAGGQAVNSVAWWDGSWHPFTSGGQVGVSGGAPNNTVMSLTVWNDQLFAGGGFISAGGQTVNRIARWDGFAWHPLTSEGQNGVSSAVNALMPYNGELIAAGSFTLAGNQTVNRITAWGITDGGEQYWVGPANGTGSGSFHLPENWLCNLVPSGAATIIFDNAVTPVAPSYTVSLGADATTRRFRVYSDEVTLNLANRHFNLIAPFDDPLPSLIVGEYADEDARLIVRNTLTLPRRLQATSISIGRGHDSIGQLTVRNTSTSSPLSAGLGANGNVNIGELGEGSLVVESNADAEYGHTGSYVRVGDAGAGALTVRTGGKFLASEFMDSVSIGRLAGASGNVLIDGGSSFWSSASNNFFIGEAGDAAVVIRNGGALFSTTLNQLQLASVSGSSAIVTVKDPGSIWFEGIQAIGVGGSGTATLDVRDGGIIEAPGINNLRQGIVAGNGTIFSDVFNVGVVSPRRSPGGSGTLLIDGNYREVGPPPGEPFDLAGQLHILIDPFGASALEITGTAELGGALVVGVTGGVVPTQGDSFPILSADSITGTFGAVLVPFLGPNRFMTVEHSPIAGNGGGTAGSGSGVVIVIGTPKGSPDFGDPQAFVLDGEPTGIAGADINPQVGARDLALSMNDPAPGAPGHAVILLNQGNGSSFDPPIFEEVGVNPRGIISEALANGPGIDDFAVPNFGDDDVSVLFHDGNGEFTRVDVPVGDGPSAAATADFNGDALMDLAVTNQLDNTVSILFNNGDRSFTGQPVVPAGGGPCAITAEELDGKHGPDLVVANAFGGGIGIIRNIGGGGFGVPTIIPTGGTPSSVDPGDIENDKDFDVIVTNSGSGTVSLVINDGLGNFAPAVNLPVAGNPVQSPDGLASWDMDSDGDLDLVTVVNDEAAQTNVIRILRNDSTLGQVAFTLFDPIGEGDEPRLVRGADVTGDFAEDLVAVNVQTLPLAGVKPTSSLAIRPNINSSVQGDTNGDGVINIDDLLTIVNFWGRCPTQPAECPADIHPFPIGNGVVDIDDLLAVINNWAPAN